MSDAIQQRPYVTARKAAELLGVSLETVVDDIADGLDGALPALIGDKAGGVWVVPAFEVEGDRLEMHRTRLSVRENDSHE